MINKAILLVGGRGTRLAELTRNTPKPMLKVAGAPVTEHQIARAQAAGVTEIVLATSYLAEVLSLTLAMAQSLAFQLSMQ